MKKEAILYILVQCMALALLFVTAIVFSGCRAQKPIVTESTNNTTIEREQVDSLIKVAADQARAQVALECDSIGNIHIRELNALQGERTRLDVALRAALEAADSAKAAQPGKQNQPAKPVFYLDLDCKADSLQILVTKLREYIKEIESTNHTETVVQEVVPNYYKRTSTGFWILLVILVLIVGWKIAKIYFKIQSGGIL